MLLGIPWFAWIAIVAIVGGMYTGYKTEKLKVESKLSEKSGELEEIRKILFHLKNRVENLEAIASQNPDEFVGDDVGGEIEIKDGYSDPSEDNRREVGRIANDLRNKA